MKTILIIHFLVFTGISSIYSQDSLFINEMEDGRSISGLSVSTMRKFDSSGQISAHVDVEISFFVKEGVENVSRVHVVVKKNGIGDTRSIIINKDNDGYYTMYENKKIASSGNNIRMIIEKDKTELEGSTVELYVTYHSGEQSNKLDYHVY